MEGLELFSSLTNDEAKKEDALLVGKNIFNQNPSDEKIFEQYFYFLCKLAWNSTTIDERKFYVNEAQIALTYFSEYVKINEEILTLIKKYRTNIEDLVKNIIDTENKIIEEAQTEIIGTNSTEIKKLSKLKDKLIKSTRKESFNSILKSVQESENKINKKFLTKEQEEQYEMLTSDYSKIVNEKLIELERMENIKYNKKAALNYKYLFDLIRKSDSYFKKDKDKLYDLVTLNLFCYDSNKLFNETIIYYNQVYAYIFNKLDEEGKYELTRRSIDAEISIK